MTSKINDLDDDWYYQIIFHPELISKFDSWEKICGYAPQTLRSATEHAILTRRMSARIEHDSHCRSGKQLELLTLSLGDVAIHFTQELVGVVVRGYSRILDRESLRESEEGDIPTE